MIGLGEQVEGCDLYQPEAAGDETGRVACQRGRVTRHISDPRRTQGQERVQEVSLQACTRRVHDDAVGFRIQRGQHIFRRSLVELDVVEFVQVDGEILAS